MSSGRGSHWISTLRNRGRVRSSFEQGRRLLAANFADYSTVIPTQRLGARFCWATCCRWFCCCCRCYRCRVCQRCSSCPAVPPWYCAGAPAAAVVSAAAECSNSARVAVLTVASAVKATVAGLRALRRAIDRIPWLLGRVSKSRKAVLPNSSQRNRSLPSDAAGQSCDLDCGTWNWWRSGPAGNRGRILACSAGLDWTTPA